MTSEDVRKLRKGLGITQELMSRLIGVSFVSVNRWENNHSPPTGSSLVMLRALRDAQHRDQRVGERLERWSEHGSNYLWSRVFAIAVKNRKGA